jgi:catechol 2,3-dioxygenase-like lactoylglutathione lyase family enzyme
MLRNYPVHPTVAVRDLTRARAFYERTLGFVPAFEFPGGVFYDCAHGTRLMLYESEFAGTNRATYASFVVKDLAEMVADLKKKGVVFETYDLPGFDKTSSIATMDDYSSAWFKDTENNIVAISQMAEE